MTDIVIDGSDTGVLSCTIDYTREGYVPLVYVVGDNVKIETSLVLDNTDVDFIDNLALNPGWSGDATAEQKEDDPTKTDVYSRFSTEPDDIRYGDVDEESGYRGYAGPYLYRGFTASTFLLDSGGEQVSATAMVESSSEEWKFTGKIGLGSRIQDGSIPYLRIQAGDKTLEVANKDNNKMVTLIIEGEAHGITASNSADVEIEGDDQPWFIPLSVISTDRFKHYKAYRSFRTGPLTPEQSEDYPFTDPVLRDDGMEAGAYADDYLNTVTTPSVSGSIEILGNLQYSIGEQISQIVTRNGSSPVNLAIVDQSTQYAPPRSAGESGQDTITIELGRK